MGINLTKKYDLHVEEANERIKGVVKETPLQYISTLSDFFESNIYLKR